MSSFCRFEMTVSEIAKLARVSTATVSRTINRVPTVDPVLARRVWRVINQVGYFPNTHARALVNGRSRFFGLMVSDTIECFFPEMVRCFADMGIEHGYEILLSPLSSEVRRVDVTARRLIERRVDGVAILTFKRESGLIEIFRRNKVPVFALEADTCGPFSNTIRIDYEQGVRQAVQHLAALGHTRIAFVSGPEDLIGVKDRKIAFESSVKEIDLQISRELLFDGDHTMQGGMKAMSTLASLGNPPSAIMCSNDLTALGLVREAQLRGLAIPRDLSVVGIDDIPVARFITPSLTTVHISQKEVAETAFRALQGAAEPSSNDCSRAQHRVETTLVLRESTGIAPHRRTKILRAAQN